LTLQIFGGTLRPYKKDEKTMLELIDKNQSDIAPEFDRVDAEGRNIKLSGYRGKSNVVVVFNRGFG
jgi:hypothetical protein